MDLINVTYNIDLENEFDIENIIIYDDKSFIDKSSEILVKGILYIDIILNSNETLHKQEDINICLSKEKYYWKNIKLLLNDYHYFVDNNILKLDVEFKIEGDELLYERFNLYENNDIENELKNYLNRDSQIDIDESLINIIEPVKIIEEEIKLEDTIQENAENKELFKETYKTEFIFYRVRKGEDVESISKKFNVDINILLSINQKEIKENVLIQIPTYDKTDK